MNRYALLLVLFIFNGCKDSETKFQESLVYDIAKVVEFDKNVKTNFLIITETDCNSCFDRIETIHKTEYNQNLTGLFYAKDADAFKKMLLKLNNNINWKPLTKRNIPNSIENWQKNVGPYIITIDNNDFSCQKF